MIPHCIIKPNTSPSTDTTVLTTSFQILAAAVLPSTCLVLFPLPTLEFLASNAETGEEA